MFQAPAARARRAHRQSAHSNLTATFRNLPRSALCPQRATAPTRRPACQTLAAPRLARFTQPRARFTQPRARMPAVLRFKRAERARPKVGAPRSPSRPKDFVAVARARQPSLRSPPASVESWTRSPTTARKSAAQAPRPLLVESPRAPASPPLGAPRRLATKRTPAAPRFDAALPTPTSLFRL